MGKIVSLFPSQTLPNTPVVGVAEHSSSSTTTPRGRAHAHAHARDYDDIETNNYADESVRQVVRYYREVFARRSCPPSVLRQIHDFLAAGMTADTLMLCIDDASEAESPSWKYAAAVARRCIEDGALTPEGFAKRNEAYQARRRQRNQSGGGYQKPVPSFLNHTRHNYSPEEIAEIEWRMNPCNR